LLLGLRKIDAVEPKVDWSQIFNNARSLAITFDCLKEKTNRRNATRPEKEEKVQDGGRCFGDENTKDEEETSGKA
jgi:hypothetical protein